jgi:hypothetical protein
MAIHGSFSRVRHDLGNQVGAMDKALAGSQSASITMTSGPGW